LENYCANREVATVLFCRVDRSNRFICRRFSFVRSPSAPSYDLARIARRGPAALRTVNCPLTRLLGNATDYLRRLVRLPTHFQVQLVCGLDRRADKDPRVCRKRQRDTPELVDTHSGSDGNCRNLRNVNRALPDNVTAQDLSRVPVNDELAEAQLATVDDCTSG